MANSTMLKFGFPDTLVEEFDHWVILLRPAQPTLGSLVLAAKGDATAFSDLPAPAFSELAAATQAIEKALAALTTYERINYLMLMMVDPNVHFHVIPRYSEPRIWNEIAFPDEGWPGVPNLKLVVNLDAKLSESLKAEIKQHF